MRVVIVGATGNVGTSLLEALADEPEVEEIVAVARRLPKRTYPRTQFVQADIVSSNLSLYAYTSNSVLIGSQIKF